MLVWNRVLSFAEIDEVHAYLNARYSLSLPLWSSYLPSPNIHLYGQSNPAGRGDRGVSNVNILPEYLGPIANANVWHGSPPNNQTLGTAWETLDNTISKPGGTAYTGNHMLGDNVGQPTLYVGPESALSKEYIDLRGGTVWLNKYNSWRNESSIRKWNDPILASNGWLFNAQQHVSAFWVGDAKFLGQCSSNASFRQSTE